MNKLDLEIFRPRRVSQRSELPSVTLTPRLCMYFGRATAERLKISKKSSIMIGLDSQCQVYIRSMPARDAINCFSAMVCGRGSFNINIPEFFDIYSIPTTRARFRLEQVSDFWRVEGLIVNINSNPS